MRISDLINPTKSFHLSSPPSYSIINSRRWLTAGGYVRTWTIKGVYREFFSQKEAENYLDRLNIRGEKVRGDGKNN